MEEDRNWSTKSSGKDESGESVTLERSEAEVLQTIATWPNPPMTGQVM